MLKYLRFKIDYENITFRTGEVTTETDVSILQARLNELTRRLTDQEYLDRMNFLGDAAEQCREMDRRYQKARTINPAYADQLFNLWITKQDDTNNLLRAMQDIIDVGPQPGPGPQPTPGTGEIKNWVRLPECDFSQPYFAFKKPWMATYGKGESYLFAFPHTHAMNLHAESGFNLLTAKGATFLSLENGPDILRNGGDGFKPCEHHPSWTLILYMIEHGGYIYAAGMNYGQGKKDAGLIRSADGITFTSCWNNSAGTCLWTPFIHNGQLHFAATTGNTDWGDDSRPAVAQWDGSRINLLYVDQGRPGEGFWSGCSFKGKRYLGGSGKARVFCMEDNRTVLDGPGFTVIHWMGTDGDTLYAALSKEGDSGAEVRSTKDGNTWKRVGDPLPGSFIFHGSFEDDGLYLAGGVFRSKGMVFKGVR